MKKMNNNKKGGAMPKINKWLKPIKKLSKKCVLAILLLPNISYADGTAIEIPFLDDVWKTITQNVLPIIIGIGLLGAFFADRHDSETGKRVLLTIAVLAVAVKVTIVFLAWVRGSFAGV
jgi:hypothetical protein